MSKPNSSPNLCCDSPYYITYKDRKGNWISICSNCGNKLNRNTLRDRLMSIILKFL